MSTPSATIHAAVRTLRAGGLVAFPTETVYGLGADALSQAAVEGVFRAKGRPSINPVIVHVRDVERARALAASWPEAAEALARALWPGPVTIVVPKSCAVPGIVTAGGPGVALRVPAHPIALDLLGAFGGPLVAPSANRSGRVSPTTAEHVRSEFPSGVLILDGGPCQAGIESTVVSLMDPARAVVLRPGVIGLGSLAEILGYEPGLRGEASPGPVMSPGMLASHYAPERPVVLAGRDQWRALASHRRVAILALGDPVEGIGAVSVRVLPADPAGYARGLYAALRELDEGEAGVIVVEPPPESPPWRAILDRLGRASAPRE